MYQFIDKVFKGALYLAGAFMVGVLLCVLGGIVSRLANFDLPGTDAYAGYCMAAATFLALASTLRHGEHIRVTLLLNYFQGKTNFALEVICHLVALFFSGALALFSLRLVYNSYQFTDISTGLDATPLWIPQIGMALGTVLFFLGFLRETFTLIQSGKVTYDNNTAAAAFME